MGGRGIKQNSSSILLNKEFLGLGVVHVNCQFLMALGVKEGS